MAFSSLVALKVVTLTTFSATSDENFIKMMTFQWKAISKQHCYGIQKQHWPRPSTKAILTQHKGDTDPVQKQYWPGTKVIPFLVPLHNVSVPAVPEPVTSPVLVYGTGTCTGTVCKTCIERYRIGTLYRIQRYRAGTTYHRWTVPERVPMDTGMFTGKPSPEPMLTNHQYSSATFIWGQVHRRYSRPGSSHPSLKVACNFLITKNHLLQIFVIFTQDQFWPSRIVIICVCACARVCLSVCLSQPRACLCDNSSLFHDIVLRNDWTWSPMTNWT